MPVYVYDPWYLQPKPPVFCRCCLPCYEGIFPTRRGCLFCSVALWILGVVLFITMVVVCISMDCGVTLAILLILAILVLWIGYLIFHCAWAAHLLEDETGGLRLPPEFADNPASSGKEPFQVVETGEPVDPEELAKVKTGYWQFAERDAWQAVSSRDRLQ